MFNRRPDMRDPRMPPQFQGANVGIFDVPEGGRVQRDEWNMRSRKPQRPQQPEAGMFEVPRENGDQERFDNRGQQDPRFRGPPQDGPELMFPVPVGGQPEEYGQPDGPQFEQRPDQGVPMPELPTFGPEEMPESFDPRERQPDPRGGPQDVGHYDQGPYGDDYYGLPDPEFDNRLWNQLEQRDERESNFGIDISTMSIGELLSLQGSL